MLTLMSSNIHSVCRGHVCILFSYVLLVTGSEEVLQAIVTLKHFFAYSIESYDGVTRQNVDVKV